MKIPQDPESTQALGQFIILTMGRVIMIGVIVALVAAWALTEPFYELSRRITRGGKLKPKQIKTNKGTL
jgi:hypothetical protein